MDVHAQIEEFLKGQRFAVVGASNDRSKYGNKVLRAYLQSGRTAIPVHPTEEEVEGIGAVKKLADIAEPVDGVSIITPPPITERVVEEAGKLGIKRVWMQPGAESDKAIARAKELGMDVLANGPCVLVALHFRERG